MKNLKLLLVMTILSCVVIFYSCSEDEPGITSPSATTITPDMTENGSNPDELELGETSNHGAGYIYTQSNSSVQNSILSYKHLGNGSLTLEATVPSGGNGAGMSLGNSGALDISDNGRWLFAVNAGSNSISSFSISHSGNVSLQNTIASGGINPVSVTCHELLVYVVNSGSDNISGFRIDQSGTLSAIAGSTQLLSASGSAPAQISFSPNGTFLYVTEKMTNKITSFPVNQNGVAGPGSSIFSVGQTPFGFDYAREGYSIVSNASANILNASSCTSYEGINSGNLSAVNGAIPNNQTAACWVAVSKHGRFAFVTNTGSNSISSYFVSFSGTLHLISGAAVSTENAPTDITVASNNFYVYAVNSLSHTISGYKRTILGGLAFIGSTPGLPEFATGLVSWKRRH